MQVDTQNSVPKIQIDVNNLIDKESPQTEINIWNSEFSAVYSKSDEISEKVKTLFEEIDKTSSPSQEQMDALTKAMKEFNEVCKKLRTIRQARDSAIVALCKEKIDEMKLEQRETIIIKLQKS